MMNSDTSTARTSGRYRDAYRDVADKGETRQKHRLIYHNPFAPTLLIGGGAGQLERRPVMYCSSGVRVLRVRRTPPNGCITLCVYTSATTRLKQCSRARYAMFLRPRSKTVRPDRR